MPIGWGRLGWWVGEWWRPALVKRAAFGAFGVAAVAGLILAIAVALWLIAVGLACIVAAWYYTGGRRPYGYAGFGEVFVFVFFGLVATAGTAFVQVEELTWLAVAAAVPVGLMASALLMANNLRDIDQDRGIGEADLGGAIGGAAGGLALYGLGAGGHWGGFFTEHGPSVGTVDLGIALAGHAGGVSGPISGGQSPAAQPNCPPASGVGGLC